MKTTNSFQRLHHLWRCFILLLPTTINAFGSSSSNNGAKKPAFNLSDRFRASCPAELSSISQFDPTLVTSNNINNDNDESIWVAVFRSSNNLPSVLIKDDFMNAMRIATTVQTDGAAVSQSTQVDDGSLVGQIENSMDEKNDSLSSTISTTETSATAMPIGSGTISQGGNGSGVKAQTPVAVAKLSPSKHFENTWTLDTMRCSLKKEDTDDLCDGQSEHAEAISVCIDELILNHLRSGHKFEKSIRTKATLVSGKLLSSRGFQEVENLRMDMATHVSSLEDSLNQYAMRAVETVSMSPGARDRALQILAFLGKEEVPVMEASDDENEDTNSYDPWANVGRL